MKYYLLVILTFYSLNLKSKKIYRNSINNIYVYNDWYVLDFINNCIVPNNNRVLTGNILFHNDTIHSIVIVEKVRDTLVEFQLINEYQAKLSITKFSMLFNKQKQLIYSLTKTCQECSDFIGSDVNVYVFSQYYSTIQKNNKNFILIRGLEYDEDKNGRRYLPQNFEPVLDTLPIIDYTLPKSNYGFLTNLDSAYIYDLHFNNTTTPPMYCYVLPFKDSAYIPTVPNK